jgi:predicted HD phosphohydrolase
MRTGNPRDRSSDISVETIIDWLRHRGAAMYGGESVTQLEHALQCATIAMAEGASSALITAALLHDFGHLADGVADTMHPHEKLAAELLVGLFGASVTEPIRMHVDA